MKLDLVKEHYFAELNRKQYLENAIALPVAVLTGLGGVMFSLAASFSFSSHLLSCLFGISEAFAILALACTFYFVARSSIAFTYEQVAAPGDLLQHSRQLERWYQAIGQPMTAAEEDFERGLAFHYASAASLNKKNNDSKAGFLYRANVCLLIAAFLMGTASFPYYLDQAAKPDKPMQIEIVPSTTPANP